MVGSPDIIIVQKSDVIRGGGAHRNVPRGCRSGPGCMQINRAECLYDLSCVRRCSVVPDNDFEAHAITLERADALEGFPQHSGRSRVGTTTETRFASVIHP